ncbi:MAG: alpha/beta fold hydrolase [Thiobacillus sp.]|nr:alpha/beta fold hydrolase [Thiobacillus sp.]
MNTLIRWLILCLFACFSAGARGELVELTLPNRVVVKAEYREGNSSKPAVLLVHGFLQTHNFHTINRLVESLAEEGYSVLAPTLSLGVPHRIRSLACESIHTHTVTSGTEEISAWIRWLKAKNPRPIILAGHSLGNVYNLAYLSNFPDRSVSKFVGISIVEGRLKDGESSRAGMVRKLRKSVHKGNRKVVEGQFSFCQKYVSTPEGLLSYMEWGPDKILNAVDKTGIPVTMIMGSRDDRLGAGWLDRLKRTRAKVIVIEGANHFMDGQYEFDLLDRFLDELRAL